MDWLQALGGAARKAMKLALHMLMPSAEYAVAVDSRRASDDPPPAPSTTERIVRKDRVRLDAFSSADAQRPLCESRDEVLATVESCTESGHPAAGKRSGSIDKTDT
jgi:hypothetical protein